jgi:hypothetical protein
MRIDKMAAVGYFGKVKLRIKLKTNNNDLRYKLPEENVITSFSESVIIFHITLEFQVQNADPAEPTKQRVRRAGKGG